MKRNIIISLIVILLIISFIYIKNSNKKEILVLNDDLISRQEKIDKSIEKYISDKYTIDNPKILINPYEINPLTAMIIFNHNEYVEVYVNNEYLYKTKEDILPIYYLISDKDNDIKLVLNKKEYHFNINVSDRISHKLKVKINNTKNKYLVSSSTSNLTYSIFDHDGNLIWHLLMDSQGILEKTKNDTFIVSAEEYITENNISNFTSLYEIDIMGKILKRIDTKYLYHHYFKILSDNTLMVCGSNNKEYPMNLIYRMDINTGNIIDEIDLYKILHDIDPNVFDNLEYGLGTNSFDYNESTNELLISMRNLNLVMSVNFKTKKINWIYTDYLSNKFNKYLLDPNGYGYLRSNHDVSFINNNTFSIYDNAYNNKTHKLDKQQGIATGKIFEIKNNKLYLKKEYKNDNKFSYAFGSMKVNNNDVLINYSYLYKNYKDLTIFDYVDNTYSKIIEYNKDKKIFEGIIDDRIYQVSIFKFNKKEYNYKINDYQFINNNDYKLDIKNTNNNYNNEILNITKNTFKLDLSNELIDDAYLIFKGDNNYIFKYNKTTTYYKVESGKYDLYLYLNGKYYNLNYYVII